ncbi:ATP-binding protein [Methanosarcina sp. KYL-1]|uniref:AAA family ATPase n=1 Tax=Methanosarcina sp. KYL-1 TaxID=2602068 RepID=UPI0021010A9E|nr:ATP-binding protein [Methanosarcina sp. KYL-1]MCQ1534139.1 ATP-binding protein [Methanosarcina sp. KYL-1]
MAEKVFVVGGDVEPPYFIGREREIQKLTLDILEQAQNNVIIGPRRIGKTSLLGNLKAAVEKEVLFVPVNCREMTGLADFFGVTARALVEAYAEKHRIRGLALKFSGIFREKITAAYGALAEIGGSIEHVGKVYLRFRDNELKVEELIAETFEFIESFSHEKKEPVLVAFDEFQELSRFNGSIFNTLKSRMDRHLEVRYIFSGSSISLLHEVFLKPDSPLYLMAARTELKPIQEADVKIYIRSRLATRQIEISDQALEKIHELTGGFPFYFQKLGFLLYQDASLEEKTLIGSEDVEKAFSAMLDEFDSEYEARYMDKFSEQQKKVLKYLSAEKQMRLSQVARDMDAPASSLTTSMRDLYSTMTVNKPEEGLYGIADNVFRLWIKRNILGQGQE